MPRYFFDLTDDNSVFTDEEGLVCRSKAPAQAEAARALGGIVRDSLGQGDNDRIMAITVRDNDGRSLVRVQLQYKVEQDI